MITKTEPIVSANPVAQLPKHALHQIRPSVPAAIPQDFFTKGDVIMIVQILNIILIQAPTNANYAMKLVKNVQDLF